MQRYISVTLLVAFLSYARAGTLEFTGVMRTGDTYWFLLTDSEGGKTSDWLPLGATFYGYKLVHFSMRDEVIVVQSDSRKVELPLKKARVKPSFKEGVIPIAVNVNADGIIEIEGKQIDMESLIGILLERVVAGQGDEIHIKTVPGEKAAKSITALRNVDTRYANERWVLRTVNGPAEGLLWKLKFYRVPKSIAP